jgi:hypothetical protein
LTWACYSRFMSNSLMMTTYTIFESSRSSSGHIEPDSAAILHFLQYPCLVIAARQGLVKGAPKPGDVEFHFHRCCERIYGDRKLGRWCRKAISESTEQHSFVLKTAIGILKSPLELKKDESRLYISLLKQSEGFDKGFRRLYEDLGRVVSLPDLPIDTTITIFKLLLVVVISGKGKGNVMLTMRSLVDTPANLCFRIALRRFRENLNNDEASKNMLQLFSALFDITESHSPCLTTLASSSEESMEPPANCLATRPVDKPKKSSLGDAPSEYLQDSHGWAGSYSLDIEQERRDGLVGLDSTSEQDTNRKLSPALLKQNEKIETEWIEADEDCDYYIFGDESSADIMIKFEDPATKSMFQDLRMDAMSDPTFALHLYCHTLASLGKEGKSVCDRLRRQLYQEYGVDPLTVEDPMSGVMLRWVDNATSEQRNFVFSILSEFTSWEFLFTTLLIASISWILKAFWGQDDLDSRPILPQVEAINSIL